MSKPTMQVEELRSFARKMDELMPRRADLVREAADTILELRDDLQRANAENAKLRELAKKLKACNSSCGRCIELYGVCDYETELRELRVEVDT